MGNLSGTSGPNGVRRIISIVIPVVLLVVAVVLTALLIPKTARDNQETNEQTETLTESGSDPDGQRENGAEPSESRAGDGSGDKTPANRGGEPEEILLEETLSLLSGSEFTWIPEAVEASGLPLKWRYRSSDERVFRVDENGTLTPVEDGNARLYARYGGRIYVMNVQVSEPPHFLKFTEEEYELEKYAQAETELEYELGRDGDPKDIVYSSSDEKVATVDRTGRILATGSGEAEITAKYGELEAVCHVTVTAALSSIAFPFASMSVRYKDATRLPLVYSPADTTSDTTTTWTSSNPAAVTVDGTGTIRAVGVGNAVITAACGKFRASAAISVVIPVTGVSVSQTAMTLNKGSQGALQASVMPTNTTEDRGITFSSDNPSVARVDGSGVVTAVAPGTARITANHGMVGAVCTVTVLSPLESIALNQTGISVIKGFTASFTILYSPADTTDPKTAVWTSSAPEIVTVSPEGVVTAAEEGTAVVTATVNGLTASAEVTVLPYVDVKSITLSEGSHLLTSRGETFQLTATVAPEDATEAAVTFSSDNASVATVDGTGLVKAVDRGTAVITASAGGKSAACTVTVEVPEPDKIVVLDPGHSSRFTGAYYFNRKEDELNLATALACKAYLESHYTGVQVYLTRSNDQPVDPASLAKDLEARAQFAQDHNADILVSLHYNACTDHSASGALVFVSAQANVAERCWNLANAVLAQLATTGLRNLGPVSTISNQYFDQYGNPLDYYAINRHSANRGIPGVIVEHCFMDHDVTYIDTAEKISRLGVLDAIGIANYLGLSPK